MGKLKTMGGKVGSLAPRLKLAPKIADRFYHSREWRSLVAHLKRERGNWCQRCGSNHRVIADHIIERSDGGAPLDPRNIELLCFTHHQQKTAKARAARAKGAAPR